MEHKNEWIERVAKPFLKKSGEIEDYQLFMRDEPRGIVKDDDAIFSCADGIVLYNKIMYSTQDKVDIKGVPYSVDDIMGKDVIDGPCLICGVFMTFADVHVNRAPYTSILEYKMLDPIQSFNYSMTDVEEKIFGNKLSNRKKRKGVSNLYLNNNSRMLNRFYIPKLDYSYYVVQIADFDVNMILHFNTKQKHQYFQGERFSFVRWGSQCDIILPLREDLNIQPLIKKNFHVEAGVDKVASL